MQTTKENTKKCNEIICIAVNASILTAVYGETPVEEYTLSTSAVH